MECFGDGLTFRKIHFKQRFGRYLSGSVCLPNRCPLDPIASLILMKIFLVVAIGTAYGLFARITFGFLEPFLPVLSTSLIGISPFIIGLLTTYLLPVKTVKTKWRAFFFPLLPILGLASIALFFKVEGLICWIMATPFLAIPAGLGGLLGFYLRKKNQKKSDDEDALDRNTWMDWDKPGNPQLAFLLLLPFCTGFLEGKIGNELLSMEQTETIRIKAPVAAVWKGLRSDFSFPEEELPSPLSRIIGFPGHLETRVANPEPGGKRFSYYQKALVFEETILESIPEKKWRLRVDIYPDKIPAGALDDHVKIGGAHLDVLEDSYALHALDGSETEVKLTSRYFIRTPFNWYARWWANVLMGDLLEGELKSLKDRCEP
jgi:hypothetical protein